MAGSPAGCSPSRTRMARCSRVLATALVLFATLAVDARGQRLLEVDGIELLGRVQLVLSGGGTCNVLKSDSSYEQIKENHGAPMDIWRLEFSVHNGSGRWLDRLIARLQIGSEWPDCTNWDVPESGTFAQPIQWSNWIGHIQESGRNVVPPGQTLTHTELLFIVLRGDPQPRFTRWSMDFDFASAPPPDSGSPAPAPRVSPQLDAVFWQSIMNSTDRADFEAYLEQFPNGVFRSLAQNRLRAFEKASQADAVGPAQFAAPPEPICPGASIVEENCWIELGSPPGCYAWDESWVRETVSWSGTCVDGLASGTGTETWRSDLGHEHESSGMYANGKKQGHWIFHDRSGLGHTSEGPYLNGYRHGHWVHRPFGGVDEGPYVLGRKHGVWVEQDEHGNRITVRYVNGEKQ